MDIILGGLASFGPGMGPLAVATSLEYVLFRYLQLLLEWSFRGPSGKRKWTSQEPKGLRCGKFLCLRGTKWLRCGKYQCFQGTNQARQSASKGRTLDLKYLYSPKEQYDLQCAKPQPKPEQFGASLVNIVITKFSEMWNTATWLTEVYVYMCVHICI